MTTLPVAPASAPPIRLQHADALPRRSKVSLDASSRGRLLVRFALPLEPTPGS